MQVHIWILVVLPLIVTIASHLFPGSPLLTMIQDGKGTTSVPVLFAAMMAVSWLAFRTAYSGFSLGRGLFTAAPSAKEVRKAIARARMTSQDRFQLIRQLRQELSVLKEKEAELEMTLKVFSHLNEAVVITDPQGAVFSINPAFSDITGFMENDILGQNMRILKSGRHDAAFYADMWQALLVEGLWTGNVWNRRKNGEIYPQWTIIKAIRNREGTVRNYVGILSDLTDLRETEQQIQFIAHFDPLTELPNRILFKDRLSQAITQSKRHKQKVGVLWIGLDRFQQVNANAGRFMGDQVLKALANRLRNELRENDTIARIGGDEFALLATQVDELSHFGQIAEKVQKLIGRTLQFGEHSLHFSASIGITAFPMDPSDAETMLKHAETAMKRAKERGGNSFTFYTQQMGELAMQRWNIEKGMKNALERKEFFLLYQPQYDVITGTMVGVEALVRWLSPQFGLVAPGQFIPLAEENGLIVPLGEWVLQEACAQNKQWQDAGYPPVHIAVNVSPRQFQSQNLDLAVEKALQNSRLDPRWLELEITESLLLDDEQRAIQILNRWRSQNLQLSIDDFGTGYSSLSYLRRYPVHSLKIDRSFIADIVRDDDEGAAIVNAILAVARSLKLKVVAEGVASAQQLEFLRRAGCDKVQGFLFGPPMSPTEISQLMEEARLLSPQAHHMEPPVVTKI